MSLRDSAKLFWDLGRTAHDPQLWRQALTQGLVQLFEARLAVRVERKVSPEGSLSTSCPPHLFGEALPQARALHDNSVQRVAREGDYLSNPFYLSEALPEQEPLGFSGFSRMGEVRYRQCTFVRTLLRPLACCDGLLLALRHAKTQLEFHLFRPEGAPPFSPAEIRAGQELMSGLGELLPNMAPLGKTSLHDLPPRQRQVFSRLIQGRSEKEIATDLSLSPATIHDHIKALYQTFSVSSRAELLASYHSLTGKP